MFQLVYFSIAKLFESRYLYIEKTSRLLKKTSFYINVRQSEQILKRRVAKQQFEIRFEYISKNRQLYRYKSRYRYAIRKSKESENRFLNKNNLKKQQKKMQKCFTNSAQNFETRIDSNTDCIDIEKTDSLTVLSKNY